MINPSAKSHRIASLRAEIGAIEQHEASRHPVLPFGLDAIDEHVPGAGLATGALHEVGPERAMLPDDAAATLFVASRLAQLDGPVFWCLKRRDLFAPGLAAVGLHPDRVIYVEARNDVEILASVEECARHAGIAGVVGEVGRVSMTASRRLQLAAEGSGVTVFALHRRPAGDDPTAALTRWQIGCLPTPPLPVLGLAPNRWQLSLVRARGAEAQDWIVEEPDAQGRLSLAPDFSDGPLAAPVRPWTADRLAA